MSYRKSPADLEGMPPGVGHIIGNEAAERFSFYGMKAVLAVFMVQYLHHMGGAGGARISEVEATEKVHLFNGAVYLTPLLGALLADAFVGKYRTIVLLSLVYCCGHAALAAIATVDDGDFGADVFGDEVGGPGVAVAHHEQVGRHRAQVGNGVEQRLALAGRAARNVKVDHIGRQTLGGDFKGGAGAGAVFKKQVEHAFAAQQRDFFHLAVADRDKLAGCVQDVGEDVLGQTLGREQVNQLTIFVQLRVSFVQHRQPLSEKDKRPSGARCRLNFCSAGKLSRLGDAERVRNWLESKPPLHSGQSLPRPYLPG